MSTKYTSRNKQRRSFRLTAREAVWFAVLIHLVILFLPQSLNPFALFYRDMEPAEPDPITFNFAEPPPEQQQDPQQQPDLVEQPEEQEARSAIETEEQPMTDDPASEGNTNLRSLPETQPQPQPQPEQEAATQPESQPREIGEELTEKETPRETEPITEIEELPNVSRREELARQERKELLTEALKDMDNVISDIPLSYNNPKPSSAEFVDGTIQFDTYAWNYQPYQAKMLKKIYEFWVPQLRRISYFRLGKPGITGISFRISKDGTIHSVRLVQAAQYPNYDAAADYAIRAPYWNLPTPFPPLPATFPNEDLGVTIGFFVNTDVPSRRTGGQ